MLLDTNTEGHPQRTGATGNYLAEFSHLEPCEAVLRSMRPYSSLSVAISRSSAVGLPSLGRGFGGAPELERSKQL